MDVPQDPVAGAVFGVGIFMILVFIVLLVRAKIAYEEQPDADLEEVAEKVFQSFGSPMATGADQDAEVQALLASVPTAPESPAHAQTPKMYSHLSRSLPPGDLDKEIGARLQGRCNSWSGWENEMFKDSFEGRERTYTVSIVGFGIA